MSVLLIVAKAPVPGLAKTRLSPPATPVEAAEIAAAALLDTVDAALAVPIAHTAVAMTGELSRAARGEEIATVLRGTTLIRQRGDTFADRLANAHADVARLFPGEHVLQIGMDTPQVTVGLLHLGLYRLDEEQAVLGEAHDGGWWALGLRNPWHAEALRTVPMSRRDTASRTREALRALRPGLLPILSDVDTVEDATRVAAECSETRFACAVAAITTRARR